MASPTSHASASRRNSADGDNQGEFLFGSNHECSKAIEIDVQKRNVDATQSRLFVGEDLTCHTDIFSASLLGASDSLRYAGFTANARKLNKHRQIDARDDLDLTVLHNGNRKIGWRPAEHVRE